jgi:hypothetical protein
MGYPNYSRLKPKFAKKRLELKCDYCQNLFWEDKNKADKKKRHFCSMKCYALYRKEIMTPSEQPTWRGGITPYEAHRRWVKKNPEQIFADLAGDGLEERFNSLMDLYDENTPMTWNGVGRDVLIMFLKKHISKIAYNLHDNIAKENWNDAEYRSNYISELLISLFR